MQVPIPSFAGGDVVKVDKMGVLPSGFEALEEEYRFSQLVSSSVQFCL